MRIRTFLSGCLLIFAMVACKDFSNRVFLVHEEIPIKPFIMKVIGSEYRFEGDQGRVKVSIEVRHKSSEEHAIKKSRFQLRVGEDFVSHVETLREKLSFDKITFHGAEKTVVTVEFQVPRDHFGRPFDLILDEVEMNGKKKLTLVGIKSSGRPTRGEDLWEKEETVNWK